MKKKSLSNAYLSAFSMELYMLQNAGITPADGILMLKDDEQDKDGKIVLQSVLDGLEKNVPISVALRESGYFPRYMVNMVEVGEQTGRLTETFKALSEHYDRQERIAISVKNAVMYPAILLVLMVAVVVILIVRVLPIFNDVFSRLGTQMSPLATTLMKFGGWLSDASVVIAVIIGLIVVVALVSWLAPSVRLFLSNAFKNIWGDRGVFGNIASSRFASAMALSVASGLETEKAVEISSAISGGAKAVDKKHNKCLELLRAGSTLSDAMFNAGIFSARNARMLSLGSRSGMTDAAMSEIANRSGRAVQDEIDRIINKVEPTLVIITSVIVGIILFSVMLPLMGIMTSIG